MASGALTALFGATGGRVLLALSLLREASLAELARVAGADPSLVRRKIDAWELQGLVQTRALGTARLTSFNPRFPGSSELLSLLEELEMTEPQLAARALTIRRRPRRKGKELGLLSPDQEGSPWN
jgi:hypothetical protein